MDPISVVFYAIVCGLLSLVAPNLGGYLPRLIVGAGVGIVAAFTLPMIRGMMGGY